MTDTQADYVLLVIGGGINGNGIALDAAGRGLRVLLCEMGDLASATSSSSSKLLHGGLRYLQYGDFRLVREALAEREILLRKAPHITRPLRFRLPVQPHLRPSWMLRAGLFLYDHLSRRSTLPPSRRIRFSDQDPLAAHLTHGFEYADAWVDDARLVVLNAIGAREQGADIRTYTRCLRAIRDQQHWRVWLQAAAGEPPRELRCRVLVNAAGPWAGQLFGTALDLPSPCPLRLVKGSHLVLPRLYSGPEAYLLQHEDQRVVFVIPYEEQFSLIGTTDVEFHGDPQQAAISPKETDYLLGIVNRDFRQPCSAADIRLSFAGVRPLLSARSGAAQAASRDYRLTLQGGADQPPLLSVFGGKLTTYRKLAESALERLRPFFPHAGPAWTREAPLPGGDFDNLADLQIQLRERYPWLEPELASRYARLYGTRSALLLDGCGGPADLGVGFGAGLYQREVDFLVDQEWVRTLDDLIWRRTKLGLRLDASAQQQLADYLINSTRR